MSASNPFNKCANNVVCACPVLEYTDRQNINYGITTLSIPGSATSVARPNKFCAIYLVGRVNDGNYFSRATAQTTVLNFTLYDKMFCDLSASLISGNKAFFTTLPALVYAANIAGGESAMTLQLASMSGNTHIFFVDFSTMWVKC